MKQFFILDGKLTLLGVFLLVIVGFLIVYLSVEYVPWKWGKLIGLSVGLALAGLGGFSGRASALDLSPPFTNDPLGWRKAKKSYETQEDADKAPKRGDAS